MFEYFSRNQSESGPAFNRPATLRFLYRGLSHLSEGYSCLDSSRPWLTYWIIHALTLCGEVLEKPHKEMVIRFLARQDILNRFESS
jgi:protein farnesyltransferase subunit beta